MQRNGVKYVSTKIEIQNFGQNFEELSLIEFSSLGDFVDAY